MMTNKFIDGQIRKIESKLESKVFFDFEFWAESDEDTYGLLCLIQRSDPTNMFITEMNSSELSISSDVQGLEAVKDRVVKETGITDLVFPKVIRFDEKKSEVSGGFQAFLKTYEKPIPVYESIFDQVEEAIQVEKISIDGFKGVGGKLHLLGDLRIKQLVLSKLDGIFRKIPESDYLAIKGRSVHNVDTDTVVLGKYRPAVK